MVRGSVQASESDGWTLNTLHDHFLELLRAAKSLEEQRFEAQDIARRALDDQYKQRFADNEKAVNAAFAAAKEAVNAALAASKEAVNAALTAAKEAVMKAEVATNDRFSSVNEFRKSLSDLGAGMLTRTESEQRFGALTEKVDALGSALNGRVALVEKFNSEQVGSIAKGESSKNMTMGVLGLVAAVIGAAVAGAIELALRK